MKNLRDFQRDSIIDTSSENRSLLNEITQSSIEIGCGDFTYSGSISNDLYDYKNSEFLRNVDLNTNKLSEQLTNRHTLHKQISEYFEKPEIKSDDLSNIYQSLINFLKLDENNCRILLYLPFDILPDQNSENNPENDAYIDAKNEFIDEYTEAWFRLLFETETRNNFTDGDVGEPGMQMPQRVSKAAHLLPKLLEKNILSNKQLIEFFNCIDSPIILQSLVEASAVSFKNNLISAETWDDIGLIIDKKQDGALIINNIERLAASAEIKKRDNFIVPIKTNKPTSYIDSLNHKIAIPKDISDSRKKWLAENQFNNNLRSIAQSTADLITSSEIDLSDLEYLLDNNSNNIIAYCLIVDSYFENLQRSKPDKQIHIDKQFDILKNLYRSSDSKVQNHIYSIVNKWYKLGIVDNSHLKEIGINNIHLDNNELTFENDDIRIISDLEQSAPNFPEQIEPVFVLFGSKAKGYDGFDSDFDGAVLFKANSEYNQKADAIKAVLGCIPECFNGSVVDFWLQNDNNRLILKDVKNPEYGTVGDDHIKFILNGIWIGDQNRIKSIKEDLLISSLDLNRYGEMKHEVRQKMLRDIESDNLQYRLMHKGYEKLYPLDNNKPYEFDYLIDGGSVFWDEGYRLLATKLFLEKVFLPDLSN